MAALDPGDVGDRKSRRAVAGLALVNLLENTFGVAVIDANDAVIGIEHGKIKPIPGSDEMTCRDRAGTAADQQCVHGRRIQEAAPAIGGKEAHILSVGVGDEQVVSHQAIEVAGDEGAGPLE